jgi:quinol monooxygenase YgiN
MIIVAGTMTFDPADIPAFADAVRAMAPTVRAEDGCLYYALLADDSVPGLVSATEMWRDDAALKVHLGQPWIGEFLGRFGGLTKSMDVKIYDVAGSRPIVL